MHPTILVQRRAQALNRIMEKADALAKHLELDPELVAALQPKGAKDSQVIEMFRLEALANVFDALAISAGVTVVTPPTDELPAGEDSTDEVAPIPIAEDPNGLPAPTLDEEQAEAAAAPEGPESAKAESKPMDEAPVEETPVEALKEEEPEETFAPNAQKKNTARGKRSKK